MTRRSGPSDWDFRPPPASGLGDREVPRDGEHLAGRRVALLVTGGIAAYRTPSLARALRRQGADVVVFASQEGLRYVGREALEWATRNPVVERLTPEAEHLSDESPFDAFLVAPATYNTINKIAAGIADTAVTATLASALGRAERGEAAVLIAPTMHGSLHTSILTESLRRLDAMGVRVIPPREDYGKHNIPDEHVLVAEVCRAVSRSLLRGVRGLVTGGPTPVPLDDVRRITNRFSGRLGVRIAEELYLRGADVRLVHGQSALHPPDHLPVTVARTYDEYREAISELLAAEEHAFGVFSAAVADYRPKEKLTGKTPSGKGWTIELGPTPKVIREVRSAFPDLHMVVFKLEEGVSRERLLEIARGRLQEGYQAVVANRGEEMGADEGQVAYILTTAAEAKGKEPVRLEGKIEIARGIADHLERTVGRAAERAARE
jgi:phosphopantothenoylcysteine decarboxylase/phosphopantothenate--cysteine ligase